jgi:hypothetical protein
MAALKGVLWRQPRTADEHFLYILANDDDKPPQKIRELYDFTKLFFTKLPKLERATALFAV